MTITKKPARPIRATKDKEAEAFIQAADHPAETSPALEQPPAAPAKKPAKAKKALDPAPVQATEAEAAPGPAAEPEPKEKKAKDKDKDKSKNKDKGKKKKDKKKEAVIIRFEDAQLEQIDTSADALGLSRAAWVRMVVARALEKR